MPEVLEPVGTIIQEPADEYHAKARKYLSSHQLGEFRKCPQLYHRRKLGLIPDEDRPAFLFGRALHTLVLEGQEQFDADFSVGGPINPKTGQVYGANTKAFREWADAQDRDILTDAQFAVMTRVANSVRAHELASDLLSTGLPERVVRAEYCAVPCQIRMDWYDPFRCLIDLKTCDDLTWFESDAKRFGYLHQLAFYRAVLGEVVGVKMPVFLIGVEKREPFRCGVWQVARDLLDIAEQDNVSAIERLRCCEETCVWPTGYEEERAFATL